MRDIIVLLLTTMIKGQRMRSASNLYNDFLPDFYDASVGWEHCLGFSVVQNQTNCSSCCAMAISNALSARECMQNGRNVLFSSQQIWDCTGVNLKSTCKDGTYMSEMISNMYRGTFAALSLVDSSCSQYTASEPSTGKCSIAHSNCSQDPDGSPLLVSSVFSNELYAGIHGSLQTSNGLIAAKALMSEIWINGPVVAILDISHLDFEFFSNLSSSSIFIPTWGSMQNKTRHCIMVYGWGVDSKTGYNYWLVHNSYGYSWSNNGKGKVIRGFNWLENEWRGLTSKQRPCIQGANCISKSLFNSSWIKNRNQIVSPEWDQFVNWLYETMIKELLNDREVPIYEYRNGLSNNEIIAITLSSGFILIFLSFLFVKLRKSMKSEAQIPVISNDNYEQKTVQSLLEKWLLTKEQKNRMPGQYIVPNLF